MERGRIQELPNFLSTPYYLRNGYSYELQIWHVYSQKNRLAVAGGYYSAPQIPYLDFRESLRSRDGMGRKGREEKRRGRDGGERSRKGKERRPHHRLKRKLQKHGKYSEQHCFI